MTVTVTATYQPPLPGFADVWEKRGHLSDVCIKLNKNERGRSCMRPRNTELGKCYSSDSYGQGGERVTVSNLKDVHNTIRAHARTLKQRYPRRVFRGHNLYKWVAMETGFGYAEVKAALV